MASRIVNFLYRNPAKGTKLKELFLQNIGLHEVFLEAVPTTLIITAIWVNTKYSDDSSLEEILFNEESTTVFSPETEFFTTYITSIVSASLGLVKCLKNGVVRPLGPGGCLDGLLTCRLLLPFFASGLCLLSRGTCLGLVTGYAVNIVSKEIKSSFNDNQKDGTSSNFTLAIAILFLPQAVLAIFCSLNLRSKSFFKIITRLPSILLLPVFTFFTFSKLDVSCSGGESRVRFSKKFSWINIGVRTFFPLLF